MIRVCLPIVSLARGTKKFFRGEEESVDGIRGGLRVVLFESEWGKYTGRSEGVFRRG